MQRSIQFNVAGITFGNRQAAAKAAAEGRMARLLLERDPCNAYDPKAVQVIAEISGRKFQMGFIPRTSNTGLSAAMDAGRNARILGYRTYLCRDGTTYGMEIAVQYDDGSGDAGSDGQYAV